MKLQNRLASLLTGAMLAVNSIGAQAYFDESDALETVKKVGMTKIYTFELEELRELREKNAALLSGGSTAAGESARVSMDLHSERYTVPVDDLEGDTLWVFADVKNAPKSSGIHLSFTQYWRKTEERACVEDGQLHRAKKEIVVSSETQSTLLGADGSSVCTSFRIKTRNNPSERLEQISFGLEGEWQASEAADFDIGISVYGKQKTDTPDPSLSEITGTTTGTAAVGDYDDENAMYITDENGKSYLIETNVFCYATLDIRQYPKRVFAVGEPFSTEGLKVVMTEYRLFNQREHDVSDCLQIRTDYDPNTPGEYTVYLRTDYTASVMVHSDDYLFYMVRVDGGLTAAETTETTDSRTAPDITALRGDVDCSGQVAIADAVLLARYIAEDTVTVTAQGLINAELDGESGLTSGDLSVLLQCIAGSITL